MSEDVEIAVDVAANRAATKWTRAQLLRRVLWGLCHPLFRFSPRPLHAWRVFLLRLFGARIGANIKISPSCLVTIPENLKIGDYAGIGDRTTLYCLGTVEIGDRSTISQGAHLCAGTHDCEDPAMTLLKLPITIGSDVWICADAFVGPGVQIGSAAVIGARGVVMKSVDERCIMAGNPARLIRMRVMRAGQ